MSTGINGGRLRPLPPFDLLEDPTVAGPADWPPILGGPLFFEPGPPSGLRPGIGGGAGLLTMQSVRVAPKLNKSHLIAGP